jgi:hypothetical protein
MLLLAILLIPSIAFGQDVAPDAPATTLVDSLPALFPAWVERLNSYATLLGFVLVGAANLAGKAFARWRAFGGTVPKWLELLAGLALDAGTDIGAIKERLIGQGK